MSEYEKQDCGPNEQQEKEEIMFVVDQLIDDKPNGSNPKKNDIELLKRHCRHYLPIFGKPGMCEASGLQYDAYNPCWVTSLEDLRKDIKFEPEPILDD